MSQPSKYRFARAHRLIAVGAGFIVMAVAVVVAFAARESGVVFAVALAVAGAVALVALVLAFWGPVVVVIDDAGFRTKIRSAGPRSIAWTDVEKVDTGDGQLVLENNAGDDLRFPLTMVDPSDRVTLLRDVHDRLNTAHGYRRL